MMQCKHSISEAYWCWVLVFEDIGVQDVRGPSSQYRGVSDHSRQALERKDIGTGSMNIATIHGSPPALLLLETFKHTYKMLEQFAFTPRF